MPYRWAAEADRRHWLAYYELANCHLARNRKDEAREALRQGPSRYSEARAPGELREELGGDNGVKQRAPGAPSGSWLHVGDACARGEVR